MGKSDVHRLHHVRRDGLGHWRLGGYVGLGLLVSVNEGCVDVVRVFVVLIASENMSWI